MYIKRTAIEGEMFAFFNDPIFVINKYQTVNAERKTTKLHLRGTQIITVQSCIIN